jgi:hypothetical protein
VRGDIKIQTSEGGYKRIVQAIAAAALLMSASAPLHAAITESQVLVVYNSNSPDGTVLKNHYLAAHPGIPAANVVDLNNALLNTPDISYANYLTLIRNPIRAYLSLAGPPDAANIVAICLIRPLPHRILDSDASNVGDNPNSLLNELLAGDATPAAVDAELALLWQNLESGEAGGDMDSKSDNFIDNPYHKLATPIGSFSRTNIQTQKTLVLDGGQITWLPGGAGATRLTPGDIYLVCRVDGNSLAHAQAEIDRAKNLYVNKAVVKILLDEFDITSCGEYDADGLYSDGVGDPYWGGDDYELTRDNLIAGGWNVRYDAAFNFIDSTEETNPLIGYASYGGNDLNNGCGQGPPGNATYLQGFHFPPGAIFNTIESYNARGLNGLGTLFSQEQVADFIEEGGTFGVGNVWEPLSITVPDNAFLMTNMLNNGLTFAEAAYTSFPALSWHQLAVGDPLGKMIILNDAALPKGDMNGDGKVNGRDIAWFLDVVLNGPANYRISFPTLDPIARGDFDGDLGVTVLDTTAFVTAMLTAP